MPPDPRPTDREARHQRKIALIFVASILLGLALGVLITVAQEQDLPRWTTVIAAAVAAVAAVWLTAYWWRQIDEAARAAHQEAFFWGGIAGLTAALFGSAIVYAYQDLIEAYYQPRASWLTYGAYGTFLATVAGYAIWWAAWWLRRR